METNAQCSLIKYQDYLNDYTIKSFKLIYCASSFTKHIKITI